MKKKEKIIEDMTRQVIKKIVYQEVYEWPPKCPTFYYQPLRPKHELKLKKEDSKE